MHKVSFIISGASINEDDLLLLEKRVTAVNQPRQRYCEFIIHFPEEPEFISPSPNILLVSSKGKIPSIKKAVVVASGDKLVFTTKDNLLADKKNVILKQALNTPTAEAAAPLDMNFFRRIGVVRTAKIPYMIVTKNFAAEAAEELSSFKDLLVYASRIGLLADIKNVSAPFTDYVKLSLPSPNLKREGGQSSARTAVEPIKYSPNIPVFIISRDRVEPLRKLIKWCEDEGLKNIIIIDNASTYPPLLNYYSSLPHEIIRLKANIGLLSPWMTGAVKVYAKNKAYIVSDSDVIPPPTAHGAVKLFCQLLNKYPKYIKAGFGLRIDDIPKSYEPRDYVIAWEKKFWEKEVEKDVYDADIDTTFAVWRPNTTHAYGPSLRTGGRFIAKHDTWYIDSKKPSAEMRYYRSHVDKTVGTWGTKSDDLPETYINNKRKNEPTRG